MRASAGADAVGREAACPPDGSDAIDVTVVMPARDSASTIAGQLDALAAQDYSGRWEVIVVDNGSTDGTGQMAQGWREAVGELTVVRCDKPGANAARNAGIARARGRYILFCDADDRVSPQWVQAMASALETHPLVAGAIDEVSLNPPDVLRGAPRRRTDGLETSGGFLPRGITANLGVRADAARSVGGFNEAYRFGATDTEFCWRLQLAGYPLSFEPRAIVAWRRSGDHRVVTRKAFKTGRAHARLFREFRSAGMPRTRVLGAVAVWVRLVISAPMRLTGSGRREWLRAAAAAAGRLVGSLEHRVVYL